MLDSILNSLAWDKSPLLPTIAQDIKTKEVLMLAYSSKESLKLSLESGLAHYFSRSKNRIWKKGEESGNVQKIEEIYIDCDSDAILFLLNQSGVACHTGNPSCFFKKVNLSNFSLDSSLAKDSEPAYNILDKLYHTLQAKKFESADKSYTASLYAKGENTICKKIVEEAGELAFAIKDFRAESSSAKLDIKSPRSLESKNAKDSTTCIDSAPKDSTDSIILESSLESSKAKAALIGECADLVYHSLVGLSYCDISIELVMQELNRRFGISGIDEKNSRKDK